MPNINKISYEFIYFLIISMNKQTRVTPPIFLKEAGLFIYSKYLKIDKKIKTS